MEKSYLIIISKNEEGKFMIYDAIQEKKYEFKDVDDTLKFIQDNYVKMEGSYPLIYIPALRMIISTKVLKEDFDKIMEFTIDIPTIEMVFRSEPLEMNFDDNKEFTKILHDIFKEFKEEI